MTIDRLPLEERRRLFAILLRMAWADGRLAPDELSALRGAISTLGLVSAGPLPRPSTSRAAQLPETPDGRVACFVAAAWIAGVDGSIDEPELALLRELATALELDDERADQLLRESASASFAMSASARAEMNAPRWALDLHAALAWTLSGPGGLAH